MKILFVLLILFTSPAIAHNLYRGEFVKVLSATKIKVVDHGSKKKYDLELKGISVKGLNPKQIVKAKKFIEYKVKNQILIWEQDNEKYIVKIGGVKDLARELLEWGLVKSDTKDEDSVYFKSQAIGKLRKEGIWSKSPSGK